MGREVPEQMPRHRDPLPFLVALDDILPPAR
jgi:hypothetical protein